MPRKPGTSERERRVVGGCAAWVAATSTLTFHLWSGATVTYQVTKSGDLVTGTTA
ncbi:hypothetical protein [Streptomyces cyaneus]|uniref:hypothetical protein n=1 Tax=Streptomyces cyaneus TaxID=1904 RepID=UPI001FEAEE3E|nr:hypothetical protein [Streptomyces cyaneus]